MHRVWIAAVAVALLGCQTAGDKKVKLETQKDKLSYSIGLNVGHNLGRDSIAINPDAFIRGVMDAALDSSAHLMTNAQVEETITQYQAEQRTKLEAEAQVTGEKNKKEGDAFLEQNKKLPGVVTLPSGLQYKVVAAGKGKNPTVNSTVTVQYSGRLLDGTEFDSSYKRGEAATFPCNRVIKGWTEALQLMKEGSKWELYIPSDLAYGPTGYGGGVIPPNATLIFQIELLSVK
ncbi:MAG TPA: FKBP-type peptidyl-prolyl cis-trans isomerase [Bacteroidota bacterium]|nr:FKBP-type peptidyl-prolyl cis-trans isomerase [Bacteroidota bacterium]